MYQIHLANKSNFKLATADGHGIAPGATWQSKDLGDSWILTNFFGAISFHDLGKEHVPGDTAETWGVLISYQGQRYVGRYEAGGRLDIAINNLGQWTITGMHIHQLYLPPVILEEHHHAGV